MNTRQTLLMACVAMTAIACSQCTSQNNNPSGNATASTVHEDAGTHEDAAGDSSVPDVVVEDVADLPVAEWLPVPGLEMCEADRLVLPAPAWPARTWTACGPGCLTAPAVQLPEALFAGFFKTGAATIHGETYVRTTMYTSTHAYHELRRFSDDAVLFVVRFRKGCLVANQQEGSPFMFEMFESGQMGDGTLKHSVGTYHLDDMQFHLHPALVSVTPNVLGWLVWNDGWAVLHGARVDVALNPAEAALKTVYQGGFPNFPRAHEDMIAWVDWGTWPTPIRRYTVKDGVKTLVQGDWSVAGLGIGDERIAWIKVTGFEASLGIYETARLAWTTRTTDPANVQIVDGPWLTDTFSGRPAIDTVGDYIAVTVTGHGSNGAPSGTFVLQVSTGKFWFIQAPPETYVMLAALGTKEVLVMARSFKKVDPNYFDNYIRYDLSKLDELGKVVVP